MISYEQIKKYVGIRFWKHIHKETLIPHIDTTPNKEEFLKSLAMKVEKMQYVPLPPRAYVVSHKQNLVVRFVPTMVREDYCIYFFCIKSLEDEIAENRVRGTFGGWRLGGRMRAMENFDDPPSMPYSTYNRFGWKLAWTEYQKRAYRFYLDEKHQYFIIFDIANFYDSISLSRLELLIRETAPKRKTRIVNLLFYFLCNWGKRDSNYERQSTGLPQDEVGDCSRILANLYLQNYDEQISKVTKTENAGYLRFADDQIIAAPDESTAKELMFIASKELAKMGLNLNANKAHFFKNRKEFFTYWSFDIFKLLEDKNNNKKIEEALSLFEVRSKLHIKFKPATVLKRLLSCNLKIISATSCVKILKLVTRKEFLTNINAYYLRRIYFFLSENRKVLFLKELNRLSSEILFNQFHLTILKFAREEKIELKFFNMVESNLERLEKLYNS